MSNNISQLNNKIIKCRLCTRLINFRKSEITFSLAEPIQTENYSYGDREELTEKIKITIKDMLID